MLSFHTTLPLASSKTRQVAVRAECVDQVAVDRRHGARSVAALLAEAAAGRHAPHGLARFKTDGHHPFGAVP